MEAKILKEKQTENSLWLECYWKDFKITILSVIVKKTHFAITFRMNSENFNSVIDIYKKTIIEKGTKIDFKAKSMNLLNKIIEFTKEIF